MKNPRGIEGDQRSDANLAGYEGFFVPEETKCFHRIPPTADQAVLLNSDAITIRND
ncbi:hypothetical protein [Thiolapillus sp.]|uniref:hypothetical protein n=1 Tax=Thiolapillus sp. TaxID=2017437 RepID=UPI0025F65A74|nr:hypothetical protein [Thiolapillus sp.]